MEFFKPTLLSILFSLLICPILIIIFGAPLGSVLLGGFSVILLSMGKSIYSHFMERYKRKAMPFS